MGTVEGQLIALPDEGLGNTVYLLDLGDGRALAIDASRDVRPVRETALTFGLRVAFAADTHLHADFLSGAVQLAHETGATVLASAGGNRTFPYRPLVDGEEVDLGGLTLRALGTPGHTAEHTAYLLLDGAAALGVFTGGSLIVGGAARTDLLGAERAEELARAQYRSVHRLADLPDATAIWPTHGAGSFCIAPSGGPRTSTIGLEKAANPFLAAPDEDAFVRLLLGGLGTYPAYFDRLSELNRRGPALLPDPMGLRPLGVDAVRDLLAQGAWLVDVRPVTEFAAGHVPGSVSIHLRDAFATWLGWVVPEGVPVVFLLGSDAESSEVAWQAAKIGFEGALGRLAGGLGAWRAAGWPLETFEIVTAGEIGRRPVLDVRQDDEYEAGHIPGAAHVELGSIARRAEAAAEGTVVMCGHGERASTAASLLARSGSRQLAVLVGGVGDWTKATGGRLEEGP